MLQGDLDNSVDIVCQLGFDGLTYLEQLGSIKATDYIKKPRHTYQPVDSSCMHVYSAGMSVVNDFFNGTAQDSGTHSCKGSNYQDNGLYT